MSRIRRGQRCPQCGSLNIIRWGSRGGRQRYKCRDYGASIFIPGLLPQGCPVLNLWLKHEMWPGRAKVCFKAGVRVWLKHEMWPGRAKVCFRAGMQAWLKHEMWPGRAKVCFRAGAQAWLKHEIGPFYGPSARNVLEQVPSCRFAAPLPAAGQPASPF